MYQNVSKGTRAIYILQVVVVNKIYYQQSSYTTGSWLTKYTHYVYDDSYVNYKTMYSGFEYFGTYNCSHFPFVYTWNEIDRVYELVDEMRENNRNYVN